MHLSCLRYIIVRVMQELDPVAEGNLNDTFNKQSTKQTYFVK